MCYVIYTVMSTTFMTGYQCSLTIPTLIAGECLLALNFPLHLRFIVMTFRTWVFTSVLFLLCLGFAIYEHIFSVQFIQTEIEGVSFGFIWYSPFYYRRMNGVWVYEIIANMGNIMTGMVPIILVSLVCGVVRVQVKIISVRRLKITLFTTQNSHPRSINAVSKTDKTVLSVCLLFIFCSIFLFLITCITDLEVLRNEPAMRHIFATCN